MASVMRIHAPRHAIDKKRECTPGGILPHVAADVLGRENWKLPSKPGNEKDGESELAPWRVGILPDALRSSSRAPAASNRSDEGMMLASNSVSLAMIDTDSPFCRFV